jgi:hypothetical protein
MPDTLVLVSWQLDKALGWRPKMATQALLTSFSSIREKGMSLTWCCERFTYGERRA